MKKERRRVVMIVLILCISILVVIPVTIGKTRAVRQEPCTCDNVTVSTMEFDTSDLPPYSHPGICASSSLLDGKIAVLQLHPQTLVLYLRIYYPDGSLFSSTRIDPAGWALSFCDFDNNLHLLDVTSEGIYALYAIFDANFTGAAVTRFNLDGTLDTTVRTGPLRDFNGDGQSYQQPIGVFINGNELYVSGFESVTAGTSGGYVTKLLLPTLQTDPTFGSIYIPSPNACGGSTSAGNAMSFQASQVLLGTTDCILAFDSTTGQPVTHYAVQSGIPYSSVDNFWGFTSFTAPTRSFFAYGLDANISTATTTSEEAFHLLGPAACPNTISQVQLVGTISNVQTSINILRKDNLTATLSQTVVDFSNWYFHSYVYSQRAYYIFQYRGVSLEAKKVECS